MRVSLASVVPSVSVRIARANILPQGSSDHPKNPRSTGASCSGGQARTVCTDRHRAVASCVPFTCILYQAQVFAAAACQADQATAGQNCRQTLGDVL
jgi:hypothetical protein